VETTSLRVCCAKKSSEKLQARVPQRESRRRQLSPASPDFKHVRKECDTGFDAAVVR
jgi:hypothetical protein